MCNYIDLIYHREEMEVMLLKVNECKVKPNKVKSVYEMIDALEKLGTRTEEAWIYVSPGIIELMASTALFIDVRKGRYRYGFKGQIISLDLGSGKIPTIRRWNLITEIVSKKISFKTVSEDCDFIYFFEAR